MKKTILTIFFALLVAMASVADVTYSRDMEEKAIMGDAEAMYELSVCYMQGAGVAQDFEKSDYWLERAAANGQPKAVVAMRALEGKTGLSDAKRQELAAWEKREHERLLALRGGNSNNGGNTSPGNQTFTVGGVSFTMVYVDGGTFTMGATSEQGNYDPRDDEKPAHSVNLSSYYIGQTEVTQELWEAVMGSNPSRFKGAKRPVECVSWSDCCEFICKLNQKTGKNFRLPTEAEWEYAARGGNKSQHYRFSGGVPLGNVAWCSDNSGKKTHDVATKPANELGIYDMSGNVREWCSDWYGAYDSSSQHNPQGPASGSDRVCRGGSWDDSARGCRVSHRFRSSADSRNKYIGLRLAL